MPQTIYMIYVLSNASGELWHILTPRMGLANALEHF